MTLKTLYPKADGTYTQMNLLAGGLFETLYVDGFDAVKDDWAKIGVSPYINAQDEPNNYVKENRYDPSTELYLACTGETGANSWTTVGSSPYCATHLDGNEINTKTDNAVSFEFEFENSLLTDDVIGVHLRPYCWQEGTSERVWVDVWDGIQWHIGHTFFTPPASQNGPSWGELWVTITVLDTFAKLNACKIRLRYDKSGRADYVHIDQLRLRVIHKTLYRSGDYTFENSALDNQITSSKLQIYGKRTSTNGYVRVYIWDGSSWQNRDFLLGSSYDWTEANLGLMLNTWTKVNNAKIYLVYMGTSTPYPDVYVDAIRLEVEYAATGHYPAVDDPEGDPDDGVSFIYTLDDAGTTVTDSFNHDSSGLVDETINYVRVYVRVWCMLVLGTQARMRTFLRTNNQNYVGVLLYPTSWTKYYTEYQDNPQSGDPWAISEVDNLEAGCQGYSLWSHKLQGYIIGECTQEYVKIDYSVAPLPAAVRYGDGLVCVSVG